MTPINLAAEREKRAARTQHPDEHSPLLLWSLLALNGAAWVVIVYAIQHWLALP
jgi:hypothetical protein